MSTIASNLQAVRKRILETSLACHRQPDTVQLLAVSKTFGAEAVIEAAEAGQFAFGENYLQEALDKMTHIRAGRPDLLLKWHFIGPIQSNKTRPIAEHFDWVHTVDREKIAQRLSEQRPDGLPPLDVCLQVNISGEDSKSGVTPEALPALANAVAQLPRLRLRGLMAIPAPEPDVSRQRTPFARLRNCLEQLRASGHDLDTLSMGMSADMIPAIQEGATIVRVGSAIFGERHYG